MYKKFLILILLFTLPVLTQKQNDRMNANLFNLLVFDISFNRLPYHIISHPSKVKSLKIKSMEVIKGWNYISDLSIPDVKGIHGIDKKYLTVFGKDGNPVKFVLSESAWEMGTVQELTLAYNQRGLISGAEISSKDTTGKLNWQGEYTFTFDGDKSTSIKYVDKPGSPKREIFTNYSLKYGQNGLLTEIINDGEMERLMEFDSTERMTTLRGYSRVTGFFYDEKDRIIKETVTFDGEGWDLVYKYDTKGNLLSVKSSDDYFFEEMIYTSGSDGLPVKAIFKYDTKSSREGVNFEFRYTKY